MNGGGELQTGAIVSIADRIKQARQLRQLSLRALGKRASLSAQAISKYERGLDVPSSGALLRLARALDLSVEFFVRPPQLGSLTAADEGHEASVREERALVARIREWLERYLETEAIRAPDAIGFRWPEGFPRSVATVPEIEDAAAELRDVWQLGLDPIENLTELLEDRGLKIGIFDLGRGTGARAFTAAAQEPIPVLVTRTGLPGDQQRLLLGSELARMLLKVADSLDRETAEHGFATAFLVPASVARFELGHHRKSLSPYELHWLKHKYGLSIQEWIRRATDLGILPPGRFKAVCQHFRANGWFEREPGDPYPGEQPSRFPRLVVQALEEGVISERRAGELLGRPFQLFFRPFGERHEDSRVALRC